MKKGCLIALIALALLALAAVAVLGIAYAKANKQFGLTEAPAVSHETLATGNTVLRIVFKPDTMTSFLEQLIPAEATPPALAKLGYTPQSLLPMFLPREIAILAAPDFASNKLKVTVFLNEKRGGPLLQDAINNGTYTQGKKPLDNFPLIKWAPEGALLPERGNFELMGELAIPDTVETAILKSWKPTPPVEPVRIEGSHHLELVMDNRNGDILAIYAAFMAAQGQDWEAPLKDPQVGAMISGILPDILDIRASADLKDFDNANINLRVDATAEKGPSLEFVVKMIWPNILEAAAKNGVTLTGDPVWDAQKGALLVDLQVSGFKPMLEKSLNRSLPGAEASKKASR
jgi:hypothetical protein